MKDFFNYLTSSAEDKKWGLYLTVTGKYTSPPHTPYPKKEHPSGYYFDWDTGRTIYEHQLIYVTEGSGILQVSQNTYKIDPGTVILLRPGVHHRYKPDDTHGWTEHYIGFSGALADHFIRNAFDDIPGPVVKCGYNLELIDIFQKIQDIINEQKPSVQKMCSGLTIKLIGLIESLYKSQLFTGKEVDTLVNQAKKYMWDCVDGDIDLRKFSKEHHISYSYFRKVFKIYTGISPHQYYLDIKIMRGKELIISTEMPITEIAYRLGFSSIQYFSRLFRQKTGQSPKDLRRVQYSGE